MVAASLGVAACSSGTTTTGNQSETTATTAASPGPSGGTTIGPTTTRPPPPAGTIPFISIPPATNDGVSAEGDGCTPTSATELPDGRWFGFLRTVDRAEGTIGLDLSCLFFFGAADAAATADGETDVPVPNDYWVRNQNPLVYPLAFVPDVAVGLLEPGGSTFAPTTSGPTALPEATGQPVWVQIVDGWVVAVQQQYFP